MGSHLDAAEEPIDGTDEEIDLDRIDAHLLEALDAPTDDGARYHLREALQLQIAESSCTV